MGNHGLLVRCDWREIGGGNETYVTQRIDACVIKHRAFPPLERLGSSGELAMPMRC